MNYVVIETVFMLFLDTKRERQTVDEEIENAYLLMCVCQGLGGGKNFPFLKECQKSIWPEHREG